MRASLYGSSVPRRICLLLAGLLALAPTAPALAAGIAPPNNPAQNVAASPNFDAECVEQNGAVVQGYCGFDPQSQTWSVFTPQREQAALQALSAARAAEGLTALRLPDNWGSLTLGEQEFVLVNLERVDRGLPPLLGLSAALDAVAATGAAAHNDPLPTGTWTQYSFGSNWAEDGQPAAAMYGYMYTDGWDAARGTSDNLDCTSPVASGCWGHRDNILGDWGSEGLMGVADASAGSQTSAQVYIAYTGTPPALYYAWADALRHGADGASGGAAPTGFIDMAGHAWAQPAVNAMVSAGVTQGTGPNTFSPDAPVTLEQLSVWLGRLLHWPSAGAAPVGTDPWAAGAMGYAGAAGLLPSGVAPQTPLSRLQAVRLIIGALGIPLQSGLGLSFSDTSTLGASDRVLLSTAVNAGLLLGDDAGRLNPGMGLTRAQAAVILVRTGRLPSA